jgi:hypothetical protein
MDEYKILRERIRSLLKSCMRKEALGQGMGLYVVDTDLASGVLADEFLTHSVETFILKRIEDLKTKLRNLEYEYNRKLFTPHDYYTLKFSWETSIDQLLIVLTGHDKYIPNKEDELRRKPEKQIYKNDVMEIDESPVDNEELNEIIGNVVSMYPAAGLA